MCPAPDAPASGMCSGRALPTITLLGLAAPWLHQLATCAGAISPPAHLANHAKARSREDGDCLQQHRTRLTVHAVCHWPVVTPELPLDFSICEFVVSRWPVRPWRGPRRGAESVPDRASAQVLMQELRKVPALPLAVTGGRPWPRPLSPSDLHAPPDRHR